VLMLVLSTTVALLFGTKGVD